MAEKKPENQRSGLRLAIGAHPALWSFVSIGAVTALLFVMVIVPGVRALQPGGSASIVDAQAKRDQAAATSASREELIDKVAGISAADKGRIRESIPAEQDVPGMITQLAGLTRAAGVALVGMDLTVTDTKLPSAVPTAVRSLDVALNIAGAPYDRIKLFLKNVEQEVRLMDFHGMTYTPASLTASVNVRSYFIPTP